MRVWVSLKTNAQVSRIEVLAAFPVDGRTICGRGVRTLLGCRSEVVLYAPLVICVLYAPLLICVLYEPLLIIGSRQHMDLAMVAAILGPPESWCGLPTSTSCPGWNTGHDLSLLLFSACLSARSVRFRRASSKVICKMSRVFCANSSASVFPP